MSASETPEPESQAASEELEGKEPFDPLSDIGLFVATHIFPQARVDISSSQECIDLFTIAFGLLQQKRAEKNTLSSSTLFYAAVEWGLAPRIEREAPTKLIQFANAVNASYGDQYRQHRQAYFQPDHPRVFLNPEHVDSKGFRITQSIASTLSSASSIGHLTSQRVLYNLLTNLESGAYRSGPFKGLIEFLGAPTSDLTALLRSTPIWLCQYRRSENTFEQQLEVGLLESWQINPKRPDYLAREMRNGDLIVFWRTLDKVNPKHGKRSDGGIVGWGRIENESNKAQHSKVYFEVTHAFPQEPIRRAEVLDETGWAKNWPGEVSLKHLTIDEEQRFRQFAPKEDAAGSDEYHQTDLSSDRAETDRDLLDRAPLAFTVAHHINRIWTEQNGESGTQKEARDDEEASFIMHIDSPWGGGKTTFANFVARILNPKFYDLEPDKRDGAAIPLLADLRMDDTEYWPEVYAKREWITVTFNAWRNQHVRPPWWNFYEVIRRQVIDSFSWLGKSHHRLSEWTWRVFSPEFFRTLSILALLVVVFTLVVINFPEVKSVSTPKPETPATGNSITLVALLTFILGSGAALFKSCRSGMKKVIDSASSSTDSNTLGEADPLNRFRKRFRDSMKSYKQPVLVIIDDLDRCEPAYVVDLVRGLLTIFKSSRVVFLLLGDKRWIEKSFAIVHEEMVGIHGEDNSSFGEHFAEKAIQLSVVLPEPDQASKDAYLDHLLLGNLSRGQNSPREHLASKSEIEDFETSAMIKFRKAKSGHARNDVIEELQKEAKDNFGNSEEAQAATQKIINREAVLRAASSERAQGEIKHSIARLRNQLPSNPRRIKRIINMIAVYQASALVVLGIAEGSKEWKQLILWIVLMAEHPSSWRTLSAHPSLADKLLFGEDIETDDSLQNQLDILRSESVSSLIGGEAFDEEDVALTSEAVEKLKRLTPIG